MSSKNWQSVMASREPVAFEDVEVGLSIPPLVKKPTTLSVFMYCAAMWLTHRIHWDQAYARSEGHRDVLVVGPLQAAYLMQMITDWLGEDGTLRKLFYRHHLEAIPGDVLTCTGNIKDKREEDGKGCLELDLLIENQNKEKVTSGTATVYIPMKHPA